MIKLRKIFPPLHMQSFSNCLATFLAKRGLLWDPTSIEERNECQRGRWALKGVVGRSHIGWGGERSILYKCVKTSPSRSVLKRWGKSRKESPKKTISVNDGLGPLQLNHVHSVGSIFLACSRAKLQEVVLQTPVPFFSAASNLYWSWEWQETIFPYFYSTRIHHVAERSTLILFCLVHSL